jgi:hypothetical protein
MDDAKGKNRVHTIVPYTEGRLSDGEKCYGLAKGVIEPNETPIQAAVRETKEETGFDLKKLLGKQSYEDFCAGKIIRNLTSIGYQGVTVLKADPTPITHTYMSSHGKRNGNYPDFRERLGILFSGVVKPKSGEGLPKRIINQPHLPQILQDHPLPSYMSDIGILENWSRYWDGLPDEPRRRIKKDVEQIKLYFEQQQMIGDARGMKMDTKLHPLSFYQEGAELLPVGTWLARSADVAKHNPLQRRAIWGDRAMGPASGGEVAMQSAQIAPAIEFFAKVAPEEIRSAGVEEGIYNNRYLQRAREMVGMNTDVYDGGTWQARTAKRMVASNNNVAKR